MSTVDKSGKSGAGSHGDGRSQRPGGPKRKGKGKVRRPSKSGAPEDPEVYGGIATPEDFGIDFATIKTKFGDLENDERPVTEKLEDNTRTIERIDEYLEYEKAKAIECGREIQRGRKQHVEMSDSAIRAAGKKSGKRKLQAAESSDSSGDEGKTTAVRKRRRTAGPGARSQSMAAAIRTIQNSKKAVKTSEETMKRVVRGFQDKHRKIGWLVKELARDYKQMGRELGDYKRHLLGQALTQTRCDPNFGARELLITNPFQMTPELASTRKNGNSGSAGSRKSAGIQKAGSPSSGSEEKAR